MKLTQAIFALKSRRAPARHGEHRGEQLLRLAVVLGLQRREGGAQEAAAARLGLLSTSLSRPVALSNGSCIFNSALLSNDLEMAPSLGLAPALIMLSPECPQPPA